MKNTKVSLVPLTADDREQFILDNQWAFKYGALMEFGERDDHIDDNGEIISRKTIERCIDSPDNETYRIVVDGKKVGGVILNIDQNTHCNELEILFVSPEEHTKGIGYGAWQAVEALSEEERFVLEILADKKGKKYVRIEDAFDVSTRTAYRYIYAVIGKLQNFLAKNEV